MRQPIFRTGVNCPDQRMVLQCATSKDGLQRLEIWVHLETLRPNVHVHMHTLCSCVRRIHFDARCMPPPLFFYDCSSLSRHSETRSLLCVTAGIVQESSADC